MISLVFWFFGAIVGSFLGVVSERVYTGQSWTRARSRCNSCGRTLGPLDLVPVLSWLAARGRCRQCGSRIPASYSVFEAILGTFFALAYYTVGLTVPLLPLLAALATLGFIVLYDLRHTIIPPESSGLLFLAAALYLFLTAPSHLLSAALVAGAIALGFFLLFLLSRGRAMGLGDAPIAFSLALLAFPHAIEGLLYSFWIGGIVGIGILVTRRGGPTMGIEVPFVPFMAAGFLLAFFSPWHPFTFLTW